MSISILNRARLLAAALAVGLTGAAHAGDVAVSVSVGQPGFYGRIDIGGQPAPRVVYGEPVWVQRQPVVMAPIYLRVPPGHERNWGRYCQRYDACGVPVYFVREDWYAEHYGPRREARDDGERWGRGRGWRERGHERDHEHDHEHDD